MSKDKVLFSSDWHISDRRPTTRIDEDFFDRQVNKVREIFAIAKEYKVSRILHGGDFFNRPIMDTWIVNRFIELMKECPVPFEIALGNHDLLGYNPSTVMRTALGTLLKAGVVQTITTPYVQAIHVTNQHTPMLYKRTKPIIVSHNMVSPDEVIFEHLRTRDIAVMCPHTIVLCGHYHRPFEVVEGSTTFLNPGCLMRCKINEAHHRPHVYILEAPSVHDTEKPRYKKVYLAEPRPAEEIFNLVGHAEVKQKNVSFEKFIQILQNTDLQSHDLEALILQIGATENVPRPVIDEATRRIRESGLR